MKNSGVLNIDIDRDVEAILNLIYEYMDKTYIGDLEEHVNFYRKDYSKDQSKEAELLKALVPFVPEDKQKVVEDVSDIFRYEHILRKAVPSAIGVRSGKNYDKDNKDEVLNQLIVKIILYKLLLNIENR
ncbi:MAG: hypothetical protein AB9856_09005 [Cellulosilyticaceae bacterium]